MLFNHGKLAWAKYELAWLQKKLAWLQKKLEPSHVTPPALGLARSTQSAEEAEWMNVTDVVHIGDLVDNHALSRHISEPDASSVNDELDLAIKGIKMNKVK